jgi:alpha-beta hydrolase superfamily lysophospholipase
MDQFTSHYEHYDEVTITSAEAPVVLAQYHSDEKDPVVIFLPGTMVHPLFYDSFLTKLCKSGFNVIGINFISHGKSPHVRELFTIEDLQENVRDAIEFSSKYYSGDIFLLGSSQGGILATSVADDERIKAVFAHDTILPELPETAELLNLPEWLQKSAGTLFQLVKVAAYFTPRRQVPLTTYLDVDRLTDDQSVIERFMNDPLCRKSYPLGYLASLFNIDMHVATDGSIKCPYVLIAAKREKLFTFDYVKKVFEAVVAPEKELLAFDLPHHIIFVESEDEVLGPIVERLKRFSSAD